MSEEFSNRKIINNIMYLIKKNNSKIGEVETACGVTPGYISKLSKEESAKPSVEFIINIAKHYKVSTDFLLTVDMGSTTESEEYLYKFIKKVLDESFYGNLEWNMESADELNTLKADDDGYVDHPLFEQETFYAKSEMEYPEEVTRPTFNSKNNGYNTWINGPCFNLKMKNQTYLYLMKMTMDCYNKRDEDKVNKIEAWLYSASAGKQFLCDNSEDTKIYGTLNALYLIVDDYFKHPKIKKGLKAAVDAFMDGDLEDDPDFIPSNELNH